MNKARQGSAKSSGPRGNPVPSAQASRLKDNHFDAKVHNKAWIAPGIVKKPNQYQHDDCGLVIIPQKSFKMKNYKQRCEIDEEISMLQSKQDFRNFKEFEHLQNGDLIITIEYCTNCNTHQGSTRHDEEKYFFYANETKQEIIAQYPTAKVYLKPLIFDPQDHSITTLYIQRRIGAFEVQVSSKYADQIRQGVVFSKLQSKQWPCKQDIVNEISGFLPTATVEINLTFGPDIQGKLGNVEVSLVPHRQNDPRPQSSISTQSKRTNRTTKLRRYKGVSNQQGVVKLHDIPLDVYVVEVEESYDYRSEQLLLNMLESNEELQKCSIVLKKQPHSYLSIRVISKSEQPINEANISIVNPQSQESTILKERKLGHYEATIEPGEYLVRVQARGFLPFEMQVQTQRGVNELTCELDADQNPKGGQSGQRPPSSKQLQPIPKPQSARPTSASKGTNNSNNNELRPQRPPSQKSSQLSISAAQQGSQPQQTTTAMSQEPQQLQRQAQPQQGDMENTKVDDGQQMNRPISGFRSTIVFVYDPYTNRPIPDVKVTLNEESTKKVTTYVTDEEGYCKIILQGVLEGKMTISSNGYFPIVEEYGTTQSKMNLYQLRELSFPLILLPGDEDSVYVMVQTNVETMPIDLKIITPEEIQIDSTHQNVEFDMNDESGCLRVKIGNLSTKKGVYRIMADVIEPECLHPQTLKLYVITKKDLKIVDVPKNIPQDQLYWDIGVVCAPNPSFLEINTPTNDILRRDKYLKDYQTLLQFLKNSRNMDLKTLLGFTDRERLEVQGDVFVIKEKITQSLDKYGFEQIKNLDYLIQSAMMSNGLFSFKKLEQKFNNLDFEFVFEGEQSTSKQKEESEDEPYEDDYEI